jgi:hypothetical protein
MDYIVLLSSRDTLYCAAVVWRHVILCCCRLETPYIVLLSSGDTLYCAAIVWRHVIAVSSVLKIAE